MPGYGGYFAVDVDKMDLVRYPGWSDIDWYYADLEPGDCMYIPFQWYHQVTAAPMRSINVHMWFGMPDDLDDKGCDNSANANLRTFAEGTWTWSRENDKPTKCRKRPKARKSGSGEL